jgi:hypothetical protein
MFPCGWEGEETTCKNKSDRGPGPKQRTAERHLWLNVNPSSNCAKERCYKFLQSVDRDQTENESVCPDQGEIVGRDERRALQEARSTSM